jgi:hypothetical protein
MKPVDTIARLEQLLDAIMLADAAWCRQRLHGVSERLKRSEPVDQDLQQVIDRIQVSAQRLQQRKDAAPVPQ